MKKTWKSFVLPAVFVIAAAVAVFLCRRPVELSVADVTAVYKGGQFSGIDVNYPYDGSLFPADIASPLFVWSDSKAEAGAWYIKIEPAGGSPMEFISYESTFRPERADWDRIKEQSVEAAAKVTIVGLTREKPPKVLSSAGLSIRTSVDPVEAPIFYREVHLPFVDAVKDPSKIRWRFGEVSSEQAPPVVLENLPVCGNCHSFSGDGDLLAMDIDYANSKGSYVITKVAQEMTLATSDVITWNDYNKEDDEQTFGLLSQVSPDGRYVISTVKDKSVFVPQEPLAFSQLFFPVKGILCVYDRQTQTFEVLPGADDLDYVQSNPTWSPDGSEIIFARSRAYDLKSTKGKGKVLLTREECKVFTEDRRPFKFDLYRIPFNDGKGGVARPVEGASGNGKSNFFAKFSPDGKWIVFCRAENYMLLQPDSELYVIPSAGGVARRLECNLSLMNSWHSFSPNGKWLVFSSKANTAYTQLFLTHIDEQGRSSRPVLLDRFTASDRAANIPEFVNTKASAIAVIHEDFLDDYSFVRAGDQFFWAGDTKNAIVEYANALELNPNNAHAHLKLGFLYYNADQEHEKGLEHLTKALALAPDDPRVHHDLGMARLHRKEYEPAIKHLSVALARMPNGLDKQYDAVRMNFHLGQALLYSGKAQEGSIYLYNATKLSPGNAPAYYLLAMACAKQGKVDEGVRFYSRAIELQPAVDTSASLHHMLAAGYAGQRKFAEAVSHENRAIALAQAAGDQQMVADCVQSLQLYREAAITRGN